MKKASLSIIIGAILSIIALSLALYSIFLVKNTTTDLELRIDTVESKTDVLNTKISTINSKISSIQEDVDDLQSDIFTLSDRINSLDMRIDDLEENLSIFQTSVGFIYNWIDNSYIPSEFESEISQCYEGGYLKTACVAFYIDHFNKVKYLEDINEHIQSPQELLENGYGDCEDYAWFMVTLINQLKEEGKISQVELPYDTIFYTEYTVYREPDGEWYYEYVDSDRISLYDKEPYMICYAVYGQDIGHCIVGLCDSLDLDEWDLGVLTNCVLFEPQDGFRLYPVPFCEDYIPLSTKPLTFDCEDYGAHNLEYIYIVMGKDIFCTLDKQWICIKR